MIKPDIAIVTVCKKQRGLCVMFNLWALWTHICVRVTSKHRAATLLE